MQKAKLLNELVGKKLKKVNQKKKEDLEERYT
jgi:hypothetical protein